MPLSANTGVTKSASAKPVRKGPVSCDPVSCMMPDMAWMMGSSAGRSRSRPSSPKPDMAQYTRRGLSACSSCQPMPSRSAVPGRKFSTNTSHCVARWRAAFCPSSVLRSSTMLRLLRFRLSVYSVSPPRRVSPVLRMLSPSGGSTLMISAPMSPSSMVHSGPAIIWVRSSTRMPCSGPFGVVVS